MRGVPPDSDLGQGDEYVIGLEPEAREVYDDRVSTFVRWGMTLDDAQAVARTAAPKDQIRRLLRANCPVETIRRIVE